MSRNEAIARAVQHNPEVLAARQAWEQSRAQARQEAALPDPELEIEYEELPELDGLGDYAERSIGLTQRIESPLKWWHRRRAGGHQANAVRLALYEMARVEMRFRANLAYDRVALQQMLLQYNQLNSALAEDILSKVQIRFKAGDVTQLDVLRAEVEAGRASSGLVGAQNDLAAAKTVLNAQLAQSLQTPLGLADSLSYQPYEIDLGLVRRAALEQRPDLLAAGLAVRARKSRQAAVRAAWWPDAKVGVFRQRLRQDTSENDFWRVSFGLELPLWAFSRQRAQSAAAKAELIRVTAERDALRAQVLLETEQAHLDLRTSAEQVILFQNRILPEAERALEVARRSYDEGKATYLALLESQHTWIETRIEYARALFAYRAAVAALEKAIAGPLTVINTGN